MGKHPSDAQKIEFLTHLQYVHQVEAARRAGLPKQTATDLKNRVAELEIKHAELGLPPPTIEEKIARKKGTGPQKLKIIEEEVTTLLEACILNKKQRKKLLYIVAKEEGFFDLYRRTIEKKLCERGLRRCKSTKKLHLTDIQRA